MKRGMENIMKMYHGKTLWKGKCSECGAEITPNDPSFMIDEGNYFFARVRIICAKCKEEKYLDIKTKSPWWRLIGIR